MKRWDLPEDWEIEAALPEYVDGEGDITRLFLADGTNRLVRARLGVVNAMHAQAARCEEAAEVELSCGRRIRTLWSMATLAAHLRAADILRRDLEGEAEAAVLRRLFWQKAWNCGRTGRK